MSDERTPQTTQPTYKSGRTLDQGMRASVIEGEVLYVSPQRFSQMQAVALRHDDPDSAAVAALKSAGLLDREIEAAKGRGFRIVVDYELML